MEKHITASKTYVYLIPLLYTMVKVSVYHESTY